MTMATYIPSEPHETCKAECPNRDVCKHGYCVPHQYSYCHCVCKRLKNGCLWVAS